MIKIIKKPTILEHAKTAANIVVNQLARKPKSTFVFLTGNTPIPMYLELSNACKDGRVSFKKATIFNLDEYVGLGENDFDSYKYYMKKHLINNIDINAKNFHIPNGLAKNLEQECKRYDQELVKYMPIDLLVCGIGHNGHIGFNEPGVDPNLTTHTVSLDPDTVAHNRGPKQGITMGLRSILSAKKIVLIANNNKKAETAVRKAIFGPVSNQCPASFLQTHPNATFLLTNNFDVELKPAKNNNKVFLYDKAESAA